MAFGSSSRLRFGSRFVVPSGDPQTFCKGYAVERGAGGGVTGRLAGLPLTAANRFVRWLPLASAQECSEGRSATGPCDGTYRTAFTPAAPREMSV